MTRQAVKATVPFGTAETVDHESSLTELISLERAARQATSVEQLAFVAVNQTHRLVDYYQCLLWRLSPEGKIRIQSISGVSEIDRHSPAGLSLQRLVKTIFQRQNASNICQINRDQIPTKMQQEWDEWLPAQGLWCPFIRPTGETFAGLMITRDAAFEQREIDLLAPLLEAYEHAWNALETRNKAVLGGLLSLWRRRYLRIAALAILIGVLVLPMRESALAPAEVIPDQAVMVSAPVKGVIKEFHIRPNELVNVGQLLFSLDDTEFKSRYEIAAKSLEVARADYLRSAQKSFSDAESKSEVELLRVRVEEKQLEKDYSELLLQRTNVRADQSGIAVFADANDWIGRPVEIGERILMLADPEQAEVRIWLAVEDSINLEPGSEVQVFLNTDPTSPLTAKIRQTSYQPSKTAEGNLAFPLKAELEPAQEMPRIGLKGTAKVYGESVSVFYYLIRRPLSALRQTLGI
ncbi:MAG: HlyD family efflux transporter periplasmic adaptor subunit [Arenicellales bacterium]|nr:HlyD family efflux transporter periplasmic adaptor subunit [Arenicellales bacterium]